MNLDHVDVYLIILAFSLFLGGLSMLGYEVSMTGFVVVDAEVDYAPMPSFNYGRYDHLAYAFHGAAYDPDGGEIQVYTWNFGDGITIRSTFGHMTHKFDSPGQYVITLRVLDDEGTGNFYSKKIWIY